MRGVIDAVWQQACYPNNPNNRNLAAPALAARASAAAAATAAPISAAFAPAAASFAVAARTAAGQLVGPGATLSHPAQLLTSQLIVLLSPLLMRDLARIPLP